MNTESDVVPCISNPGSNCNSSPDEPTMNGCGQHECHDEFDHILSVVDAFFYYNTYQRQILFDKVAQFQSLSAKHKSLLEPGHSEHTRELIRCIEQNQKILEMIICEGAPAMGDMGERALYAHQGKSASGNHMSKINSTLKQIAREWSDEGREERDATYGPLLKELNERFPKEGREKLKVLVPGAGLARLGWEVAMAGFDSVANEHSSFMLITSYILLNFCSKANEFTVHPYVSSTCNVWSYSDRVRPVTFPDMCPTTTTPTSRDPPMSMKAGDFLHVFDGEDGRYAAIVTSWFIDTAHNVIEYIERINSLLIHGGVWINAGPLTYHYSDTPDELSIELPFEEILRIASMRGFRIENERRIQSLYAGNKRSMLRYQYECGFFVAIKESNID